MNNGVVHGASEAGVDVDLAEVWRRLHHLIQSSIDGDLLLLRILDEGTLGVGDLFLATTGSLDGLGLQLLDVVALVVVLGFDVVQLLLEVCDSLLGLLQLLLHLGLGLVHLGSNRLSEGEDASGTLLFAAEFCGIQDGCMLLGDDDLIGSSCLIASGLLLLVVDEVGQLIGTEIVGDL